VTVTNTQIGAYMAKESEEHLTLTRYLSLTSDAQFIALLWKNKAECTRRIEAHPEHYRAMDWFPIATGEVPFHVQEVCNVCPVRVECLAYAVFTHQSDGIWGGRSVKSIKRIRRKIQAAIRRQNVRPR